jgi:hypothetical protein
VGLTFGRVYIITKAYFLDIYAVWKGEKPMARVKMVCPITKGVCTECPIYRGRHFYLCFSKEYHGASLEADQIDELKAYYKSPDPAGQDATFGMPDDIQLSPKCIQNVEELVERREL